MDEKSELFSLNSTASLFKKNILLVILVLGGVLMLIVGGLQFFSEQQNSGIEFVSDEVENEAKSIFIDISGAVNNPGVYEFSQGARISDAIQSAGDFIDDVNEEYLSKNLNQAQLLVDGMKLYIPFQGEEVTEVLGDVSTSDGLINLNSASKSKLEELPRIGSVTAEKIISGRPYESVNDLIVRKVVGVSVFEAIKDLVVAP